jgi:HSP20 family protein
VVKAELPGMKKEEIDVSVSENMLNISGERKEEAECAGAESYRAERYFGRFYRSIPLPVSVEGDKIHAEYKDGILTITCPKAEEAKRKQIEVKVE